MADIIFFHAQVFCAHDSEHAATSLHHVGCLSGVYCNSNAASLDSSNQPWKSALEEQLLVQLWGHLCDPEEARRCIADGASLDKGRVVHCFHESETKSFLCPMMMQADNHMQEILQLKQQPLKERKCEKKKVKRGKEKKE